MQTASLPCSGTQTAAALRTMLRGRRQQLPEFPPATPDVLGSAKVRLLLELLGDQSVPSVVNSEDWGLL